MKKIVWSILCLLLVTGCQAKEEKIELTCEEAKKETSAILLDVRSKNEYNIYHLPEAKNIDVNDLESVAESILEDKDAEIIVYCQSGTRSKKALEILKGLGYTNVKNMTGGITSC